ncbi:MAG: methyltransferase domain-containing protein [Gammaproteobacteria bacterium]|nr:methyltransferase domain-containing protein [Gammaproteobacteria bacterium]
MKTTVDGYTSTFDAGVECRKEQYSSFVNQYYDLVTDFYLFGWGKSFHFAPRQRGESLKDAINRHQNYLAEQLSLKPGMNVIDLGCGVGGPLSNLVRSTGASITGINNNGYQIEIAMKNTKDVSALCSFIKGDFMHIPERDNKFDAAYAFAATVHAPDETQLFREVFRILRPGGCFASYEWCLTETYDPEKSEHRKIKENIMLGNGLQDIPRTSDVSESLKKAGFEILKVHDQACESDPKMSWYRALEGRDFTFASIPRTPLGRSLTNLTLRIGEKLHLVPQGSRAVSTFLNKGADALVAGGRTDTFTPMYFFLARKPEVVQKTMEPDR